MLPRASAQRKYLRKQFSQTTVTLPHGRGFLQFADKRLYQPGGFAADPEDAEAQNEQARNEWMAPEL